MSLDFFQKKCQGPPLRVTEFGLCDDQDGQRAYTDITAKDKWIATVKNDNELDVVFSPVDKCVLFDDEYPDRGRCDGMLTTHRHLYLVELKDKMPPWQSDAIRQLESTIEFLRENHDLSLFKLRKAYASNKRGEKFVVIDNELNRSFYKRTTFRIDIQAEIVIF